MLTGPLRKIVKRDYRDCDENRRGARVVLTLECGHKVVRKGDYASDDQCQCPKCADGREKDVDSETSEEKAGDKK